MNSELRLRQTAERDLAFVIATETAPECAGLVGQSSYEEHLCLLTDPSRSHWVVQSGQSLVGYAITYDLTQSSGGFYLKRLVVANKGRGIGRRAVALLAAHAATELRSPYMWLGVFPHNSPAIRCYEACGFGPFDASPAEILRHQFLADGQALNDCILYRLALAAGAV